MGDTDISSLKQFGKQINNSQPKSNTKNQKEKKKEKRSTPFKNIVRTYKTQLLRLQKHTIFSLKKKYEDSQLTRFLYKKQKERYDAQKKKETPVKYTFLKETKKQIGNTTIIIRKRVQKPPSKINYYEIDRQSSGIFDIFIPDEKN